MSTAAAAAAAAAAASRISSTRGATLPPTAAVTNSIITAADQPIPPRWLNCPRFGRVIGDIFLPFKTPLDRRYDAQVPVAHRFSPEMLLSTSAGRRLGLVIDLTRTDRYYDRNSFVSKGVQHYKLECRGHDEAPTEDQAMTFVRICQRFREQHPGKLVGVHCTHGFNRTGFLICAFMVEADDLAVEMALAEFCRARPDGIYKEDYVKTLCQRYDGDDAPFLPVKEPSWAAEDADLRAATHDLLEKLRRLPPNMPVTGQDYRLVLRLTNDVLARAQEQAIMAVLARHGWVRGSFSNQQVSNPGELLADLETSVGSASDEGGGGGASGDIRNGMGSVAGAKRKRDQDADEASCETEEARPSGLGFAVRGASCPPVGPPHLGPLRRRCRLMVGAEEGTAFPGQQPVSLSASNLERLKEDEYLVSWKADGTRYLLMSLGHKGVFAVGRDNSVFKVQPLHLPRAGRPDEPLDDTLIDGELVCDRWRDSKSGKDVSRWRFLAYDLVRLAGKDLRDRSYRDRLAILFEHVVKPRDQLRNDGAWAKAKRYDWAREPFSLRIKPFVSLLQLESPNFCKMRASICHASDGLIFARVDEPYTAGRCNSLLKFKDAKDNSVDFMVKVSESPDGKTLVADLLLQHRGGLELFKLTKSQWRVSRDKERENKAIRAYHNRIVECVWNPARETWIPRNVRNDKTHPNAMSTAESVFDSIRSGLEESTLQVLVLEKRKRLMRRARKLLRAAVRASSVPNMESSDRAQLLDVLNQLAHGDDAAKKAARAAGWDYKGFSEVADVPHLEALVTTLGDMINRVQ